MNRHTVEDTRNLAQLPEIGQEIYREYRAEGLTRRGPARHPARPRRHHTGTAGPHVGGGATVTAPAVLRYQYEEAPGGGWEVYLTDTLTGDRQTVVPCHQTTREREARLYCERRNALLTRHFTR